MNKKYEMLFTINNQLYSNYASSKKELRRKLIYFVNDKGLLINDYDRENNIQVSKKIRGGKWLIYSTSELLNDLKLRYEKGKLI